MQPAWLTGISPRSCLGKARRRGAERMSYGQPVNESDVRNVALDTAGCGPRRDRTLQLIRRE